MGVRRKRSSIGNVAAVSLHLFDSGTLSLPDFVLVKARRVGASQRPSNIIHIAHELGLDVEQFERTFSSAEITARWCATTS